MTTSGVRTVPVTYFSDVLCVWAYFSDVRLETIQSSYGARAPFDFRFCSIFPDARTKIRAAWEGRDAFQRFNAHLCKAADTFPEVAFNRAVWLDTRPASSTGVHVFLKAAQLAAAKDELGGSASDLTWKMRCAFFQDARDISSWQVQCAVARETRVDLDQITARVHDGSAYAALGSDYADADATGIKGSPTFVLNGGRQKLYGNVGYRIIHANIEELLSEPNPNQASWC